MNLPGTKQSDRSLRGRIGPSPPAGLICRRVTVKTATKPRTCGVWSAASCAEGSAGYILLSEEEPVVRMMTVGVWIERWMSDEQR
jgi:hypothetical protein